MIILLLLIPLSILVATGFLIAFIWAVRAGQFDDTCTPALRPLMEEQGGTLLRVGVVHEDNPVRANNNKK